MVGEQKLLKREFITKPKNDKKEKIDPYETPEKVLKFKTPKELFC